QVAPSAYWRHAARGRNPELRSLRAKRDEQLMVDVQRVWEQNFKVYGVRKVWKQLNRGKRSISSIIVRSRAFQHRIGVEQIPENRECQMERKGIRLTGNLIWSRSPAKGSAPRLTPNMRVLPSPACIIGADV